MRSMYLLAAFLIAHCLDRGAGDPSPVLVEDDSGEWRTIGDGAMVLVEDIHRRVKKAGGNVQGVIVASMSWSTADDLDLHLKTPGGEEISFSKKKAAFGELDVDMCVHGRHSGKCEQNPVENIVFSDQAAQGRYEIYVQNFNYHPDVQTRAVQVSSVLEGKKPNRENRELRFGTNRPVPFEVLVKVEGTQRLFSGLCTPATKTHAASNIKIFEFEYFPNALTEEGRMVPIFEQRSDPTCVAFKHKMLGDGGAEKRPRLDGGSGSQNGQVRDSSSKQREPDRKASASSGQKKPSTRKQRATHWEKTKQAALGIVRAATRDTLLAKPNKILKELLTDLGTTCRGCLDKSEIVDRLQEVAGVPQGKSEL